MNIPQQYADEAIQRMQDKANKTFMQMIMEPPVSMVSYERVFYPPRVKTVEELRMEEVAAEIVYKTAKLERLKAEQRWNTAYPNDKK